jgi:hypothetical protein
MRGLFETETEQSEVEVEKRPDDESLIIIIMIGPLREALNQSSSLIIHESW